MSSRSEFASVYELINQSINQSAEHRKDLGWSNMKVAERIGKVNLLPRMNTNKQHHARRLDKPNSATPEDNIRASKTPEMQAEIRVQPHAAKAPQKSQQKRSQAERDSSDEEQQ